MTTIPVAVFLLVYLGMALGRVPGLALDWLRAFKGSQNYAIPAGIDVAGYGSVVNLVQGIRSANLARVP
jgi:hypothetical protein